MTSVLFLVLIALLAVGLAATLAHYALDRADGSAPEPTKTPLSFIAYLHDLDHHPALIAYTPLGFDPTHSAGHAYPPIDSIKTDLHILRSGFDGLVLYGYDAGITPSIVAEAVAEEYRAILLGIWNPRSEEELDGTVRLVKTYGKDIALAICLGNEGITFNRYTLTDLVRAAAYLDNALAPQHRIPFCTSEPLGQYAQPALRTFGEFLAPNIHPVFDRPGLTAEGAAYWTREQALRLAQLAQKPILVKETGFPHAGKPLYTPDSQKRFWQAYNMDTHFIRLSEHPPIWISYAAAFEAFDQPWKAQQSFLPIEQFWGFLDQTRTPSQAFSLWLQPIDGP